MAARTVRSSDADELLHTIEAVHAAGLEAELWPKALASTASLMGAAAAILEVFELPSQVPKEFHSAGVPPVSQLEYFEHYAPLSPRAAYAFRYQSEKLFWDYKFIDEPAMDRDAFYAKLLPQADFRYFLAGRVHRTANELGAVSIQRTRKQGHVGKHEIGLMTRLLPHFRQALDTSMRLRRVDLASRSLEDALNWLADGVAIVAGDGEVLYANQAMRAITRRGDGISMHGRMFGFASPAAHQRFSENLAAAAQLAAGDSGSAPSHDFPAARPAGIPPYLISLRPLLASARENLPGRRAVAIVLIRDPQAGNPAALRVLREIYGLTQAEASLAEAIQSGASLGDYARARRLSLNTVYTHLRRIKEKTGCKRMTELIHTLKDLRVPLRIE
jgi:DNA-binding CsgD family transcriptional regulator/PAS domain-containing protein